MLLFNARLFLAADTWLYLCVHDNDRHKRCFERAASLGSDSTLADDSLVYMKRKNSARVIKSPVTPGISEQSPGRSSQIVFTSDTAATYLSQPAWTCTRTLRNIDPIYHQFWGQERCYIGLMFLTALVLAHPSLRNINPLFYFLLSSSSSQHSVWSELVSDNPLHWSVTSLSHCS